MDMDINFDADMKMFLGIADELDKDKVAKCSALIWEMSPEQRKTLFYSESFRESRIEYAEFTILYAEDDTDDLKELIENSEKFGTVACKDLIAVKQSA